MLAGQTYFQAQLRVLSCSLHANEIHLPIKMVSPCVALSQINIRAKSISGLPLVTQLLCTGIWGIALTMMLHYYQQHFGPVVAIYCANENIKKVPPWLCWNTFHVVLPSNMESTSSLCCKGDCPTRCYINLFLFRVIQILKSYFKLYSRLF